MFVYSIFVFIIFSKNHYYHIIIIITYNYHGYSSRKVDYSVLWSSTIDCCTA